jgi:hypothetical protein
VVSRVLPLLTRRPREVGEWLPPLSRHGLALGDVALALRSLWGDAAPLSPASLTRRKAHWQLASEVWQPRRREDLAGVDVWADGRSVKAGLEAPKAALRLLIGALPEGQKVGLAVESGQRESTEAWGAMLRARHARGRRPWRWTLADGQVGLWAA